MDRSSILFLVYIPFFMDVYGHKYAIYNKTDVNLEISYIPVNSFASYILHPRVNAGSIKPNQIIFFELKDPICLRTIFATDLSGKYTPLEDDAILG